MRHILTTAAIALSMLALPAQAATFTWWKNVEPDSYGLKISGPIVKDDAEQFRHTLLTAHPRYWRSRVNFTVHLDSVGGMVAEAVDIGNTIRIFKFNTLVADGVICASACGFIWLAGGRRYLGANAAVGFHTVYDPKTRQPTPTGLARVEAYLLQLGIGQSTFRYLMQAPPDDMEWLTADKAREQGIEAWTCIKCSRDKTAPVPDSWPGPVRTIPGVLQASAVPSSKIAPESSRIVVRTVPIAGAAPIIPRTIPNEKYAMLTLDQILAVAVLCGLVILIYIAISSVLPGDLR